MSSRSRSIDIRITGSASQANAAIKGFRGNLRQLRLAAKELEAAIKHLKQEQLKQGASAKKAEAAVASYRAHQRWLTRSIKGTISNMNRFERAWRKGFIKMIKDSGTSLEEFGRKQAEKDRQMLENVQATEEAGGAIGQFQQAVRAAGEKLQGWGQGIRVAGNRLVGLGRQLSSAGRQMVFFSGILAGTAREMIGDLSDFSQVHADIRGAMLLNQEAGEDLGQTYIRLNEKIKTVADQFLYSEQEVSKLAQALISGGMSGSDAIKVLEQSAQFARANMLDMAEAGELVVRSMAGMYDGSRKVISYIEPGLGKDVPVAAWTAQTAIGQLAENLDILTLVGAKSTESLDSIRAAIGFTLGSAQKFGGDVRSEIIASLVHLIRTGESATVAGRRIQAMFEDFVVNSDKLGFSVVDARGNFLSFFQILSRLKQRLADVSDPMMKAAYITDVFGENQANTLPKLLDSLDALEGMAKSMEWVGGATETLAKVHMAPFEGETAKATSAWQDFRLELEKTITGPLTNLLQAFTKFLENEELITFVTNLAAAFADNLIPKLEGAFEAVTDIMGSFGITGEEAGEGLAYVTAAGLVLGPGLLGLGMAFEAFGATLNIVGTAVEGLGTVLGGGPWGTVGLLAAFGALALLSFWKQAEGEPYFTALKDQVGELGEAVIGEGGLLSELTELVDYLGNDMLLGIAYALTEFSKALTIVLGGLNDILGSVAGLQDIDVGEVEKQIRKEMEREWRQAHPRVAVRPGMDLPIDEAELQRRVALETSRIAKANAEAMLEARKQGVVLGGVLGALGFLVGGPYLGAAGAFAGYEIGKRVPREEHPIYGGMPPLPGGGFPAPIGQFGGRNIREGVAYLHRSERVLRADEVDLIRNALMGRGGRGDITINLTIDTIAEGQEPYSYGKEIGLGIGDVLYHRMGGKFQI
jgi:TP901 family phage tail tape measure protein